MNEEVKTNIHKREEKSNNLVDKSSNEMLHDDRFIQRLIPGIKPVV